MDKDSYSKAYEKLGEIYREEDIIESDAKNIIEAGTSKSHQKVAKNLYKIFKILEEKGIGEIYQDRFDVFLGKDKDKNIVIVQPDLVFVSRDRLDIVKEDGIHGAPDLVVEIVSPSSFDKDTKDKRRLYETFGVKEYWLVDPEEKSIMIYSLRGKEYKLYYEATQKGLVCSELIEGFCVELKEIFGD